MVEQKKNRRDLTERNLPPIKRLVAEVEALKQRLTDLEAKHERLDTLMGAHLNEGKL